MVLTFFSARTRHYRKRRGGMGRGRQVSLFTSAIVFVLAHVTFLCEDGHYVSSRQAEHVAWRGARYNSRYSRSKYIS